MFIKDWQLIYAGDHRRKCRMAVPKKNGESFIYRTIYHSSGRIKMKVGETYTVQEQLSKMGMFRIKINKIAQVPFSSINTPDAQAMGYHNLDHWKLRWLKYYPELQGKNPELFLVDFDLV